MAISLGIYPTFSDKPIFSPQMIPKKRLPNQENFAGTVLLLVVAKDSGASDFAKGTKAPVPLGPRKLSCGFWDFGGLGILGSIQLVSPWGTLDEFSIQQFEVLSPQNATRNASAPAALLVAAATHRVAGDLWLLKSSCPAAPGWISEILPENSSLISQSQ